MSHEPITLDDIPASTIPFAQMALYGPMGDSMGLALQHIARCATAGNALRITHAPRYMVNNLRSACRWRWPGTQVRQQDHVIVVIPPQI
jgi:hypothetical protein